MYVKYVNVWEDNEHNRRRKGKRKEMLKEKKNTNEEEKKLLKNRSLFGRSAAVRSMTSIWVVSLVMSAKKGKVVRPIYIYIVKYSIYTYNI